MEVVGFQIPEFRAQTVDEGHQRTYRDVNAVVHHLRENGDFMLLR